MTENGGSSSDTERVMVDIETLGLEPGSAILSIGAVKFDSAGQTDEFYREIDVRTCEEAGLIIDIETLDWHIIECSTFSGRTLTDGVKLATALKDFYVWAEDADEYWANSPKFDATMLEAAGEPFGVSMPWEYYELRDVRTIKTFPGVEEPEFDGTEHNALDDAKHQARIVSEALQSLKPERDQKEGGA